MENELKVNATVVASHRGVLNELGKSFGGQFFRVTKEATNPRHAQDVIDSQNNDGLDLVTNRSIQRFKIVGTNIVAVEVGETADGASVVYINRNRKVQVGDKTFSQEAVIPIAHDARLSSDASDNEIIKQALNGDKSKIFADPDLLVEKINALNELELTRVDKFIEKLKAQRKMIVDTINSNVDKARKYRNERTGNNGEKSATAVED